MENLIPIVPSGEGKQDQQIHGNTNLMLFTFMQ